jgi:homogentisate 1,2-dioxygenase
MFAVRATCYVLRSALLTRFNWIFQMLHSTQPTTIYAISSSFWHTRSPSRAQLPHAHNFSNTNRTQTKKLFVQRSIHILSVLTNGRTNSSAATCTAVQMVAAAARHLLFNSFYFPFSLVLLQRETERQRERCLSAYNLYCSIENMAVHTPLRITI